MENTLKAGPGTLLGADELILNMGPQHPSTHGVLRVKLKLDGERVVGSECVIGYLHRGVEKIAEHRTYQQFAPYVDRMDYVAAVSNGLGYCEAVEKLLGVEAPPRARVIRTILTELQRVASNLLWLGTHALDIGALTPLFYCLREREEILKHKWIESEKAGYDIGFEQALTDWIVKHRSKWRKSRQAGG